MTYCCLFSPVWCTGETRQGWWPGLSVAHPFVAPFPGVAEKPGDLCERVVHLAIRAPTHKASIVAPSAAMNQWEQGQGFEFAIGVSVRARTMARAQSKADELFGQFERVVRYFLGPAEHIEVGVLSYTGRASRRSMTVLDGSVAHLRHSNVGAFQPFRIDHPTLVCESYTRIWNLLGADRRLTALEQRVLRAVEWVGEAAQESPIQSAFLKGAIALELLLVGKETKFANASISARLAETVALLVKASPGVGVDGFSGTSYSATLAGPRLGTIFGH